MIDVDTPKCPVCGSPLQPVDEQGELECFQCAYRDHAIKPHLLLTLETTVECLDTLAELYRMFSGNPEDPLARETNTIAAAFKSRLHVLKNSPTGNPGKSQEET